MLVHAYIADVNHRRTTEEFNSAFITFIGNLIILAVQHQARPLLLNTHDQAPALPQI